MKALRIPCLLLSVIFLMILLNSLVIGRKCQGWIEEVYAVDSLAAQEDWTEAEKKLSALYQEWQDDQLYLRITIHRETLDSAEEQFRCSATQLSQRDISQLRTTLTSLAAQLHLLAQTEQIHLRNIF